MQFDLTFARYVLVLSNSEHNGLGGRPKASAPECLMSKRWRVRCPPLEVETARFTVRVREASLQ